MKVTIYQDAKTALICPDDNVVGGPAIKMLIDAAPFVNAQLLAFTASKCKKPGLACAHEVVCHAGIAGEETSKNPRFRGLNDN